jgi:hypothetical protein
MCRKAQGDRWSGGTRLLARLCGTGHQQVVRAIKELETDCLVQVLRGRSGQRSSYLVIEAAHIATLSKPKSGTHCDGAAHIVPEAAHIATRKRQRPSETKKPPTPLPEILDTAEFKTAWNEWIEYRRQSHKPLTAIGMKRQLNFLAKQGHKDALVMIERSIRNGWQGLFERKDGSGSFGQPKRLGRAEAPAGKYPAEEPELNFGDQR